MDLNSFVMTPSFRGYNYYVNAAFFLLKAVICDPFATSIHIRMTCQKFGKQIKNQ